MDGEIQVVVQPLVLGIDDPVAGQAPGSPIVKSVNE
jgi:hypothetical protein